MRVDLTEIELSRTAIETAERITPTQVKTMSRELSTEEARILEMIQSYYGPQDDAESITWTDAGEAILWVKDRAGVLGLMVHLTNLAEWRLDGTIPSDAELQREWLQMGDG